MQRTGIVALRMVVGRINERFGTDFYLDSNAQGYRLSIKAEDYSPRLKATMMRLWLEAFEAGLQYQRDYTKEKYT